MDWKQKKKLYSLRDRKRSVVSDGVKFAVLKKKFKDLKHIKATFLITVREKYFKGALKGFFF